MSAFLKDILDAIGALFSGPPAKDKLIYKIHPSIGVARVGNAPQSTFFLGPELPGLGPREPGGGAIASFKVAGGVRPQGARFRIWEYELHGKKYRPTREITAAHADVMRWKVDLANRKAAFFQFRGYVGETEPYGQPRADAFDARTGVPPGNLRRNQGRPSSETEIVPGPRSIAPGAAPVEVDSASGGAWPMAGPVARIGRLGTLRTDADGRLVVIGGRGLSAGDPADLVHYANNEGWLDDVSDGPVTVELKLKGAAQAVAVKPAWVLVGPPDFAPPIGNVIRLWDTLFDVAARALPIPADDERYDTDEHLRALKAINDELFVAKRAELTIHKPDFTREVYPLIRHTLDAIWVNEDAASVHRNFGNDFDAAANTDAFRNLGALAPPAVWAGRRDMMFNFLRVPDGIAPPAAVIGTMPKLFGDAYEDSASPRFRAVITHTQYLVAKRWQQGQFLPAPAAATPPAPPAALPASPLPQELDRAALEACVGGSFYPGIEVGWQIRNAGLFSEPFRIDHAATSRYNSPAESGVAIRPGHFSRQMALPWHADFLACVSDGDHAWWPAQRPDDVLVSEAAAQGFATSRDTGLMRKWTRHGGAGWTISGVNEPDNEDMVASWWQLGFVVRTGSGVFVERDRSVP